MDPLTAASLAGTIVQFVDFGSKLLINAQELYRSTAGTLTTNQELELVTTDLHFLIDKLRHAFHTNDDALPLTKKEQEEQETFQMICNEATKLAEELLERLDALRVKGIKHRKWESFRQAVKSAWFKDEVTLLVQRLRSLKEILETRTLFSIKSKLDVESIQTSSRFDSLDRQTQIILSSLVDKDGAQEISDRLNTLIQLVSRVDRVNEDRHCNIREMILEQQRVVQSREKQAESGVQSITAKIEMLNVTDEKESDLRQKVNREIIQSLQYPLMTSRYENIVEAYQKTFEWAFEESIGTQLPWSNLSHWLKEGEGVYWISGKAGSGKSTLMKHIFDDPRTRSYLDSWANISVEQNTKPIPLFVATYFFWNSGSPEQKSQLGLIRSLMWQVLSRYPDLVSVILPDLWAKKYSSLANNTPSEHAQQGLTLRLLIPAFRTLIRQNEVPLKLCFLIDGLDEFDGNQEEIANLFKEITESRDAKACLSSRPWVVFAESFQGCPFLRLQDLTHPDITRYIYGKFSQHQAFHELASRETEAAPALLREIVDAADGVFLWVRIVVKSLLDGIMNRDDIAILLRRLRALPRELEPLYDYLLSRIDPIYIEWASKSFQIVRTSRQLSSAPFGKAGHGAQHIGVQPISILIFHLAINDNFNKSRRNTPETLVLTCRDTEVHLAARCAGLLELGSLNSESAIKTKAHI